MKLEKLDNLQNLSSDLFKGAFPSVPPPIPTAYNLVSNSKSSKHSKLVFILVGSFGHSNLSRPLCHPNTCEYSSVMQCFRCLASFPRSRNELVFFYCDKISYHKVQYLSFCIMETLFLSCHQVKSLLLPLRMLWTIWISGSMVKHGAAPLPPIFTTTKVSLLGSPCMLAS